MEKDPLMEALQSALEQAAIAYRHVAENEMRGSYGSIDKIYDCVRNFRNLQNKAGRVERFNSVY